MSWSQNYNVHCSLDAVMDSIRNYDTSEAENDTDTDCSPSETWLQLLLNQVRSIYLRFLKIISRRVVMSPNGLHQSEHFLSLQKIYSYIFHYFQRLTRTYHYRGLLRMKRTAHVTSYTTVYINYSSKTASKSL